MMEVTRYTRALEEFINRTSRPQVLQRACHIFSLYIQLVTMTQRHSLLSLGPRPWTGPRPLDSCQKPLCRHRVEAYAFHP
jgi:hypothetical protein